MLSFRCAIPRTMPSAYSPDCVTLLPRNRTPTDKLRGLPRSFLLIAAAVLAVTAGIALLRPSSLRRALVVSSVITEKKSMATASKWIPDGSTRESVWKYPRPPALEKTDKHLRVVWNNDGKDVVLADTRNAYRVLESELTCLQKHALMLTSSLCLKRAIRPLTTSRLATAICHICR